LKKKTRPILQKNTEKLHERTKLLSTQPAAMTTTATVQFYSNSLPWEP